MRVAAFQMRPILDDARAACAAVTASVSWAADEGAVLAVFPETYLHGHSYDRETIARRARALTDPEIRGLTESLGGFPVTVVVGMFESRENSLRNVALVLRAGEIAGVYVKARPNENGVEAGRDMPVFDAGGHCFAVNIWVVSSDVAGACGTRMSLGCTAIVSPQGKISARVPEGTTGGILLDLTQPTPAD